MEKALFGITLSRDGRPKALTTNPFSALAGMDIKTVEASATLAPTQQGVEHGKSESAEKSPEEYGDMMFAAVLADADGAKAAESGEAKGVQASGLQAPEEAKAAGSKETRGNGAKALEPKVSKTAVQAAGTSSVKQNSPAAKPGNNSAPKQSVAHATANKGGRPNSGDSDVRRSDGQHSYEQRQVRPQMRPDPKVTALLAVAAAITPEDLAAGISPEDPKVVALRSTAALFEPEFTGWIVLENKAVNPDGGPMDVKRRRAHFEHWLGILCLLFNKEEQKDRYSIRLRTYFTFFELSGWQGRRDCSKETTGRLLRKALGQKAHIAFVELLETASFKWVSEFEGEILECGRAVAKEDSTLFGRLRKKVTGRIRHELDIIAETVSGVVRPKVAVKVEASAKTETAPQVERLAEPSTEVVVPAAPSVPAS